MVWWSVRLIEEWWCWWCCKLWDLLYDEVAHDVCLHFRVFLAGSFQLLQASRGVPNRFLSGIWLIDILSVLMPSLHPISRNSSFDDLAPLDEGNVEKVVTAATQKWMFSLSQQISCPVTWDG